MANPEHLATLKQGVEVWNKWKQGYVVERPDLVRADLRGKHLNGVDLSKAELDDADLSGADLTKANLFRARLARANLTKTILTGANLSGTHLSGASLNWSNLFGAYLVDTDLTRADLEEANLEGANLRGAYLVGANLQGANLTGANLQNANFEGASFNRTRLRQTIFANTNLTDAKHLDTCIHEGPSTIDSSTLKRSGPLPEAFFRGVGLSDHLRGDHLAITFTSDRYGHLTPIEYALRTRLGDAYIVEKDADRIVVKLDSAEQFQAALDAVVPVLAALERSEPGEVKSVTVTPKEGDEARLEGTDLQHQLAAIMDGLDYLSERFDEEHPPGRATLSAPEEAVVEAVAGGPSGLASLALRRWFEAGDRIGAVIDRVSLEIYGRFTSVFASLKRASELPSFGEDTPRQLPPASDEDP